MSLNDTADFQRKIHDFQMDIIRHLEMMAEAYMKATNIPPEECELVVETLPDKMVYRFQRRRTQRALDVCPECAGVGTREYYEGVLPCVLCDGTGTRG